jgi:ATPase subunit of ABC transporter with duplicated ATPase domains
MVVSFQIEQKSFGAKQLYTKVDANIDDNEKVGLIGRNGTGKSTLLGILEGTDTDYSGSIQFKKGLVVASTRQEHHDYTDMSVIEYILSDIPHYAELKHILDTYPEHMGDNLKKIHTYSDALTQFSDKGFYQIEDHIIRTLEGYQLDEQMAHGPLGNLSGGQKRFVELTKLTHSKADLLLIDEPTNHMDAEAKQQFIDWMKQQKTAMLIVTHDRDVLDQIDRILELRDKALLSFPGNYSSYIHQNKTSSVTDMAQYEVALKTLENLHKQIQSVRAKKASTGKTPNPFIPLERRLLKQYDELKAQTKKPSFWIDSESHKDLKKADKERYSEYKATSIKITTHSHASKKHDSGSLLQLQKVVLGYEHELFEPVTMSVKSGDRIRMLGRNGAGKSTLLKHIISSYHQEKPESQLFSGEVVLDKKCRIGVYEQEIQQKFLDMTIKDAVGSMLDRHDLQNNEQIIMRYLGDYMFNPHEDADQLLGTMSGGQKARFQLMAMFMGDPNLLILDEPTNHLDLPSIEELESTLNEYHGAIIYVSHDSFFVKNVPAEEIRVMKLQ